MRAIKLLLVLLICSVPATADSVYDVTGALTIVGNNACGGPPCVETLAFSFQLENVLVTPNQDPPFYLLEVLPGATVTSFGPLAPFTINGQINSCPCYVAFFNPNGAEIDIGDNGGPHSAPVTPVLFDVTLFSCGNPGGFPADPTCVEDFAPSGVGACCVLRGGTLQYTATAAPEGSTLSYMAVGLILLGTLARRCIRT
jgi:hypothetical protein